MLLGHVNHSVNKIRLEKLKPNLSRALQQLCDSSNLVTTYLLGDDLPKRMKEVKETSRIALTQKPTRTPKYGYSTSSSGPSKQGFQSSSSYSSKQHFLAAGQKPKTRNRQPQHRGYRN